MRNPWWRLRRRAQQIVAPEPVDDTGTDLVIRWIDTVTTALAEPPKGPPEAAPARVCDGMFTAATIAAVLIEKVADRTEYRVANNRCMAAAVDFMKVLGEDTLRRHRIHAQPVGLDQLSPDMNELAIARHLAQLGEALQLSLCAVTTDDALSIEVRDTANDSGLLAADVLVEVCQAIQSDPTT
ncbi:hypothetical protein [Nocardia donostiensis]|uniref:Uncharacterized protein n=1 Tax=Nocardia donostiensis TaxID=1538463 RepID=A0A1W0B403_9NOCA|nr:hypothetical protein [Nocardia donostiensis]ONM50573.1 hypothetical protein B0T46_01300 [Nocardia donostiensis]OQS17194.1 hypothetical protein B0T36_00870 [Nocardia donostiensis]OQS20782.1 hypothetical protein B0T44_09165 [Nocardia donostiensis]